MGHSAASPKPTHADAYQGVPRPVGAMAHDLPPAHEIPWHSHPRFQLIYAVRGVMLIDTRDATWLARMYPGLLWNAPGADAGNHPGGAQ
jgi:hypothetical protein